MLSLKDKGAREMDYQPLAEELVQMMASIPAGKVPQVAKKISQGEFRLLAVLKINGSPLSPTMLAQRLSLSSGRVSLILQSLEKKNYLQRIHQDKDRREVVVLITAKGEEFLQKCYTTVLDYSLALGTDLIEEFGA